MLSAVPAIPHTFLIKYKFHIACALLLLSYNCAGIHETAVRIPLNYNRMLRARAEPLTGIAEIGSL
jgi:hypothetical protein